jgi:D-tyrosyl-tRNA(Tyr) deacylase
VAGAIDAGVVVLLGVGQADTAKDAAYIADKIAHLRIFEDENGKMNRSLIESAGAALIVSQFTLYGDARGQRRPSFVEAAPPEQANALYEECVRALRALGVRVETGVFRARMNVELTNDGPVTILLDSAKLF